MSKDIDYGAIKRELSIERVAEYLDLPRSPKDQIRCACPACQTDNERSLAITKSEGKYYCFAVRKGGDCIALVAHVKGIGQRRSRAKFPERHRARQAVADALRRGKITKPKKCSRCRNLHKRIEGHHTDYSNRLQVIWLCPPCHEIADNRW